MSIQQMFFSSLATGGGGHVIAGSALFGGSGHLSKTFGSAGSNTTRAQINIIFKRATLGVQQRLFSFGTGAGSADSTWFDCFINAGDQLNITTYSASRLITTQVFRDPSAYLCLTVLLNTNESTANNRLRVFLNGTEITAFGTRNNFSSGDTTACGAATIHAIGIQSNLSGNPLKAYMARFVYLDGQAATNDNNFGETTSDGFFQINAASGLTFGNNGFLLSGSENVSIGNDTSIDAALTGAWESSAVSAANVADGGTYTFSSQDIGTAASNRNIIVVASTGGAGSGIDFAATCTVAGTSIARIVDLEGNDNNDISVYQGVISSGTSADVVITVAGGTMEKCGIAVHAVFGDKVSLNDLYTQAATTAAPSGAVDVPAGGVIIAANKIQGNGATRTTSWTNATEVYDQVLEAGTNADMQSGAYTAVTTAATVTVTATASGATFRNSLVVMSFSTGNNFIRTGILTQTIDSPINSNA